MPTQHPLRDDGSVVANSNFFKELQTFPWRREWVKAVLRCIHRKEGISPPGQPIQSLVALNYLEVVCYKIVRGMKNLQFQEVYDEWIYLLSESGSLHPIWNREDCEFIKTTLSWKQTTADILQEIVSFKRQGVLFTYELLGFTHSDIDDVFNWSRVTDNIRAGGIDEPWMGLDRRVDSVSEEDQSEALFHLAANDVGNEMSRT